MAALAAFKRANHQLAQIFRPLIERRRSRLDQFYGFGAIAIYASLTLPAKRREIRMQARAASPSRRAQLSPCAGEHAPLPALGNELVEKDQHPAQSEQWQIGVEPLRKSRILCHRARRPRDENAAAAAPQASCRDAAGYRPTVSPDRPNRNIRNRRTPKTHPCGAGCCEIRNRTAPDFAIPAADRPQNQGQQPAIFALAPTDSRSKTGTRSFLRKPARAPSSAHALKPRQPAH